MGHLMETFRNGPAGEGITDSDVWPLLSHIYTSIFFFTAVNLGRTDTSEDFGGLFC